MTLESVLNTEVHLLKSYPLRITLVTLFLVYNLTTDHYSEVSMNTKSSREEISRPLNYKLLFFYTYSLSICVAILRLFSLAILEQFTGIQLYVCTFSSVTSGQLTISNLVKLKRCNLDRTGRLLSFKSTSQFKSRQRSFKTGDESSKLANYLTSVSWLLPLIICNFDNSGKISIIAKTLLGVQKLALEIDKLCNIGDEPGPSKGLILKVLFCLVCISTCNSFVV